MEFLIRCDLGGSIESVVRDDSGIIAGSSVGAPFPAIVERSCMGRALDLLLEIRANGKAAVRELRIPVRGENLELHFSGRLAEGRMTIAASPTAARTLALLGEAWADAPSAGIDMGYYYDEISRLNNELINARRELSKKNAELERLSGIKDRFLAITSHDLRSPIASTIAGIALLQGDAAIDEATRREYLDKMSENMEFMLSLVEDILDTSAIESGMLRLQPEVLDVARITVEAIQSARAQAEKRGIEIECLPIEEGCMASVDPVRLRQALGNVISNAVKFSASGGRVDVGIERSAGSIAIRVADRGQGIPAAQLERLFLPYSSASARTEGGEKNTGLGLYIARSIALAHGGSLDVASEEGQGTVVELRLPEDPGQARAVLADEDVEGKVEREGGGGTE